MIQNAAESYPVARECNLRLVTFVRHAVCSNNTASAGCCDPEVYPGASVEGLDLGCAVVTSRSYPG